MLGSGHSLKVEEEPFSVKKLSYPPLPVRGAIKARIFSDIILISGTAFEANLRRHKIHKKTLLPPQTLSEMLGSAKKLSYTPLPVRGAIKARIFSDIIRLLGTAFEWFVCLFRLGGIHAKTPS